MHSKPERPLRLFVNPFAIWTDIALKAGEAMWSSYAAAARANAAPKVAVIPTADAPLPKSHQAAKAARAKVRHKTRAKTKSKRRARR
jgi:hypothetical protein